MAGPRLTGREDEVRRLVITGLTNDQIATRLAISRRTVEAHMRTLFRKTGVTRRADLAALADSDGPSVEPSTPWPGQVADLQSCQQELRCYADAVHGLVDRQFPLFEEQVEITLVVAEQDGSDSVIERRWTRPRPYLVYRFVGPIMAGTALASLEPDELRLACKVKGQDTQVDVHVVRDVNGRPLIMILFQPGLQAETEWLLRYRSPMLWNGLRRSGRQSLSWSTATFDQRYPATTSELTLKVVFPSSWTGERLTENSDIGTIHTERLPTGQTQFTWHHDAPDAGAYHWLLEGTRAT